MAVLEVTLNPLTSLEEILNGAADLAALPQVVLRIMDLTTDRKATATDLEKVIGMDPAMAAKILRLANSSYFGLPRQVSTLREAVVFLGFQDGAESGNGHLHLQFISGPGG